MTDIIAGELDFDGAKVVDDLNRLLRLRTTPIGMKLFARREEMEQVPRIRRPKEIHTTDQIVGKVLMSRNEKLTASFEKLFATFVLWSEQIQ